MRGAGAFIVISFVFYGVVQRVQCVNLTTGNVTHPITYHHMGVCRNYRRGWGGQCSCFPTFWSSIFGKEDGRCGSGRRVECESVRCGWRGFFRSWTSWRPTVSEKVWWCGGKVMNLNSFVPWIQAFNVSPTTMTTVSLPKWPPDSRLWIRSFQFWKFLDSFPDS